MRVPPTPSDMANQAEIDKIRAELAANQQKRWEEGHKIRTRSYDMVYPPEEDTP